MSKIIFAVLIALPVLSHGQITLLNPFGGEVIQAHSVFNINWDSNLPGNIEISFSSDGGASWEDVVTEFDASLSTFAWTVPYVNSNMCKIRVSSLTDDFNKSTSYNFAVTESFPINSILVDEEYDDWDFYPDLAQVTPDSDTANELKMINDDRMLYIYFKTDDVLSLQNDNDLVLYIDTDEDYAKL